MVCASGYVEADSLESLDAVVSAFRGMDVEVGDINDIKIVFLIEREKAREVRERLESLSSVPGVKSVYLAYFSLDEAEGEAPATA